MGKVKKPSLYADRGTIGSPDELDEYGVWVKSEPHDLVLTDIGASAISGSDDMDFEILNLDEQHDFDASENEVAKTSAVHDDFDLPLIDLNNEEADDSDIFNFGDFTGADTSAEISKEKDTENIDDLAIETHEENAEVSGDDLTSTIDAAEEDSQDFSIEMTEHEASPDLSIEMTEHEASTDLSINITEHEPSTDLSIEMTEHEASPLPTPFNEAKATEEDINLDLSASTDEPAEAGFKLEDIDLDLDAPADEHTEASAVQEEHFSPPEAPVEQAITKAIHEDRSIPHDLSTQLLMKIADELSSIRNELSSLKREFSGLSVAKAATKEEDLHFYGEGEDDEKISLTGDELNHIISSANFTEEAGADASSEIQEDVSLPDTDSIEGDISLDFEVSPEEMAEQSSVEQSSKEQSITDSQPLDIHSNDLGFIGFDTDKVESEISPEKTKPATEVPDSLATEEEDIPAFSAEESGELSEIMEKGVEYMTSAPAPEDSDYLAKDPLAKDMLDMPDQEKSSQEKPIQEMPSQEMSGQEMSGQEDSDQKDSAIDEISIDLSADDLSLDDLSTDSLDDSGIQDISIDLSEAVIDEPDLSSEIHENPLEEPSLEDISLDDISIDIDLSDLDSKELLSDELIHEETVLDMDLQEGGDLSLIPEAFGKNIDFEEESETEAPKMEALETETVELEFEDLDLEELESVDSVSEDHQPSPEKDVVFEEELELLDSAEETDEAAIEATIEEIKEPETVSGPVPVSQKSVAVPDVTRADEDTSLIPSHLKQELKTVLTYMDQLLEALPDEKIEEFAKSEYYDTYKKLFKELGLVQ